MPSKCFFQFDRPQPIYYSGETIVGKVVLTTSCIKSVNAVFIRVFGEAKVRWEEQKRRFKNGKIDNYTILHTGRETYLNNQTKVFGSGDLPAGTHIYKFSIRLLIDCPTAVVGKYGKVAYELSLIIDRCRHYNNEFKQSLTVLQNYNLNMNPKFLIPLKYEEIKNVGLWACASGAIVSTFIIPFRGYAPGQHINFSLRVDNQSLHYDLDGIEVKLMQTFSFTATKPENKTNEIVNTLTTYKQEHRVARLSEHTFADSLLIPSVPPTTMGKGLIQVRYHMVMVGLHTESEIEVPIVIGTIPLAASVKDPTYVEDWLPQVPDFAGKPAAILPPKYTKWKLPWFEDAANLNEKFVDIDIDECSAANYYVPKYPMYTKFSLSRFHLNEDGNSNASNEICDGIYESLV